MLSQYDMSKTPLRIFVTGFKKKFIQRNPIIMTYADYDYILYEIESHKNWVWNKCEWK